MRLLIAGCVIFVIGVGYSLLAGRGDIQRDQPVVERRSPLEAPSSTNMLAERTPVPVLLYPSDTTLDLASQFRALSAAGYQAISLDDFLAGTYGPRSILLAFSGSRARAATVVLPALKTAHVPAIVFVVSGLLEDESGSYLNRDQVKELADSNVTIGSQTVSNLDLVTLGRDRQQAELMTSREILSELSGKPVTTLLYPAGGTDESIQQLADLTGYAAAFDNETGAAAFLSNPYALPVLPITNETETALLERIRLLTETL